MVGSLWRRIRCTAVEGCGSGQVAVRSQAVLRTAGWRYPREVGVITQEEKRVLDKRFCGLMLILIQQCPSGFSVAAIAAILRAWGGHEGFENNYLPHISSTSPFYLLHLVISPHYLQLRSLSPSL